MASPAQLRANRANAQKSTGPRTDAGKAASRGNALKHGLAAHTIVPVDTPGEPAGAYQARLDAWVDDLAPRNVLELAMVQRACRASWKLDRCARYEDAAAAVRQSLRDAPAPHPDTDPESDPTGRRSQAARLGGLLMFELGYTKYAEPPDHVRGPDEYDNPPHHVDALATFREGVEWLLDAWAGVLPHLPGADGSPAEGAEETLRRARMRAYRLLGVPTGAPAPAQPLREAGEAEIRRLRGLLGTLSASPEGRLDADLALFSAGPEAQLLMRYESQAERELHRAVNTLLKLRKDPGLVPATEPAAESPAAAEAPPPAPSEPAPPAQNEPSLPGLSRRPAAAPTPRTAPRATRNGPP